MCHPETTQNRPPSNGPIDLPPQTPPLKRPCFREDSTPLRTGSAQTPNFGPSDPKYPQKHPKIGHFWGHFRGPACKLLCKGTLRVDGGSSTLREKRAQKEGLKEAKKRVQKGGPKRGPKLYKMACFVVFLGVISPKMAYFGGLRGPFWGHPGVPMAIQTPILSLSKPVSFLGG